MDKWHFFQPVTFLSSFCYKHSRATTALALPLQIFPLCLLRFSMINRLLLYILNLFTEYLLPGSLQRILILLWACCSPLSVLEAAHSAVGNVAGSHKLGSLLTSISVILPLFYFYFLVKIFSPLELVIRDPLSSPARVLYFSGLLFG